MRKGRVYLLVGAMVCGGLSWGAMTAARATTTTTQQQRVCPFPVVGGDPDTVTLSAPIATSDPTVVHFDAVVNESPGEPSHVVTGHIAVSTEDGNQVLPPAAGAANAGPSPITIGIDLATGHTYTLDWQADFDFGVHPCASAEPGQSPFAVTT
jgi:hypothetical protein